MSFPTQYLNPPLDLREKIVVIQYDMERLYFMIYFQQIEIFGKLRKLDTNANGILFISAQFLLMVMTAVKCCTA